MATKKVPDNMTIYEGHRQPPKEALKTIGAGRLKGMSDINPMWRIKALTEEFGPCGFGWYYTVDQQWIETSGNESVGFVNISLYIKVGDEWSKPIFGTGGSKFLTQERNGAYLSDEVYKMATTDAISVACKQLGIAADVYWNSDRTKYTGNTTETKEQPKKEFTGMNPPEEEVDKTMIPEEGKTVTAEQIAKLKAEMERTGVSEKQVLSIAKVSKLEEIKQTTFTALCNKFALTQSRK